MQRLQILEVLTATGERWKDKMKVVIIGGVAGGATEQQESEGWTKRQRLLFLRSQVMFPMQTADFPTILAV